MSDVADDLEKFVLEWHRKVDWNQLPTVTQQVHMRKYGKQFELQELERGGVMFITMVEIRRTKLDALSTDELGLFIAWLEAAKVGYKAAGLEVPEDITTISRRAQDVYALRLRDEKERELKTLESRLEALRTNEEKRKGVEAQIAALQSELGFKQEEEKSEA